MQNLVLKSPTLIKRAWIEGSDAWLDIIIIIDTTCITVFSSFNWLKTITDDKLLIGGSRLLQVTIYSLIIFC